MKEFVGLFANHSITHNEDNTVSACAELIVLTSEPVYYIGDTMFHRERPSKAGTLRFAATRSGIKAMIEGLQKVEADLIDLEERVFIDPKRTYVTDDDEAVGC